MSTGEHVLGRNSKQLGDNFPCQPGTSLPTRSPVEVNPPGGVVQVLSPCTGRQVPLHFQTETAAAARSQLRALRRSAGLSPLRLRLPPQPRLLPAEGIPSAGCLPEPAERRAPPLETPPGLGQAAAHAPYLGQVFAAGSTAPVTAAGGLWRCQPVCASVSACPRLGGPTRSGGATRGERPLRTGAWPAAAAGDPLQTCGGRRPPSLPRQPARVRGAVPAAGRGGGAGPRLRPWPAPWPASCSPRARGRSCPATRGRSRTGAAPPSA